MTATQEFLLAFRFMVVTHEPLETNTKFVRTQLVIIQNILGLSHILNVKYYKRIVLNI